MGQVGSQSCGVAVRPAFHRVSGKTPVLGTIETRELLERIVQPHIRAGGKRVPCAIVYGLNPSVSAGR
jgi:hypothetical protein